LKIINKNIILLYNNSTLYSDETNPRTHLKGVVKDEKIRKKCKKCFG